VFLIAVPSVYQSRGTRERCSQEKLKPHQCHCIDTLPHKWLNYTEAKVCTVVGLKLCLVIFIYLVGEGGWGAAHNFNCPPPQRKRGVRHVLHLVDALVVLYDECVTN